MFTNAEFKDFMQKHETEILKNDWTAIYDDLLALNFDASDNVPKLTNFLLNKAHINPLYYMTSVPDYFAKNLDIKSVIIPNSVESIDDFAFQNCSKLTSITIPNSVRSIGYAAFQNCSGLITINMSVGVTSIEDHAFSGCTGLTSITIPNNVTEIGYNAFSGCSSLTSITISNGVTEIGYRAFSGCSKLNEIKYTGNQQQWNKLLAKSRNFANWIHENKVKVNLL